MKVSQLQESIAKIANLAKAIGSPATASSVQKLSGFLDQYPAENADAAIEALADDVARATGTKSWRSYLRALRAAGADFESAKLVIAQMESDKALGKDDLEALLGEFTGATVAQRTRAKAIQAIETKAFEIARQASQTANLSKVTPW